MDSIVPSSDAPESFHFWCALTVVSASLRRNVYWRKGARTLFPNLFTILIARPAIGKGDSIAPAIAILKKAATANILSDRITMPFALSKMSKGWTKVGVSTLGLDHTACLFAEELSTFTKASENELDTLNVLWNAPPEMGIGTITRGDETIDSPALVMLGGTTPDFLHMSVPSSANGVGFTRRVNFVFSNKHSKENPFPPVWDASSELINDLKHIGQLTGEMILGQAARPVYAKHYSDCRKEISFEDESEANYRSSEWTNTMKVAMVLAVCESDSLIITKQHYERALKLASEVKRDLRKVFSYVGESDVVRAGALVYEFITKSGFVTANQIIRHMRKEISWMQLTTDILPTLVNGGVIAQTNVGGNTVKYYDPDTYNASTMAKKVGAP